MIDFFLSILDACVHGKPVELRGDLDYTGILSLEQEHNVLGNGVFGNMTQAQQLSRVMTNEAVARGSRTGNANLLHAIFPGRKYLMAGYPRLVEQPWLLPIYWVKRWVRFFTYRARHKYHLALESVEISNRKIELLRKYDVLP